jgi:hypothetical protein
MAVYEVSWTAKLWYTRVIEANSRREAVEISEDMGNSGAEIDFPDYKVSEMKAKKRNESNG